MDMPIFRMLIMLSLMIKGGRGGSWRAFMISRPLWTDSGLYSKHTLTFMFPLVVTRHAHISSAHWLKTWKLLAAPDGGHLMRYDDI